MNKLVIGSTTYNVESVDASFYRESRWNVLLVVAATSVTLNSPAILFIDDIELNGFIISQSPYLTDKCQVALVAGVSDINVVPSPSHSSGPSLKSAVNQLLRPTGNILNDQGSDTGLLSKWLTNYSINGTISVWKQLSILLSQYGAVARFGRDGQVVCTRDTNPSAIVFDKSLNKLSSIAGSTTYSFDKLTTLPLPGYLNDEGDMIEAVHLQIDTTVSRLVISTLSQYSNILWDVKPQVIDTGTYIGTVTQQLSNWKLQIRFDDPQLFGSGVLSDVPIRSASPLISCRVVPGTRVAVKFDSAGRPYADAFISDYGTESLQGTTNCLYLGNPEDTRPLARVSDGTISYMPTLYKFTIQHSPITISGGSFAGILKISPAVSVPAADDLVDILSELTPVPVALKLPGMIKTGTSRIKSD